MPIKAIIWDIGGVIARTEDPTPRDLLAADLGVTRDHLNDLFFSGPGGQRAQRGEVDPEEHLANIRAELGLRPHEHPDLQDRFFAGDRVDYELVDFIRSLKPRYKTGIISNAWSGLPQLLETWDIARAFDVVIGSGDEKVMKPDPRIFHLALDRLDVEPQETVFVDDFVENVEGARRVGMNAIHFRDPAQTVAALRSLLESEDPS